jgi:hypothetical protein
VSASEQTVHERDARVSGPRFEPEQEIRFAVVMFGGVSPAIYINGVAQELSRLVRATAPETPFRRQQGDRYAYHPDAGSPGARRALSGSEQVYRELGQWLGIAGVFEPPPGDGPRPVRTRFAVNIISAQAPRPVSTTERCATASSSATTGCW